MQSQFDGRLDNLSGDLVVQKFSQDSIASSIQESLVRAEVGTSSEDIRVETNDRSSPLSADVEGAGRFELRGRAPHGEDGSLHVATLLVQRLNLDGGEWDAPEEVGRAGGRHERGIDCIARSGSRTLQIQVTKADGNPDLWKDLGARGAAEREFTAVELAQTLSQSIANKAARMDSSNVVLALDATFTVAQSLPPVVEAFPCQATNPFRRIRL